MVTQAHPDQSSQAQQYPSVNRIDHFVLQVNDVWRAFEFYRDLLGAKVDHMAGMDTGRLWHRGNQILFIQIAGHKGVGFCVSNVEVPPAKRLCEHYTFGFEVTPRQFDQMQDLLRKRNISYETDSYEPGFLLQRSLFFQDLDGHTNEVCVRAGEDSRQQANANRDGAVMPLRISHIRVEVTSATNACRWFEQVLGFELIAERAGQVYLKTQEGDQLIILKPTSDLSVRREFVRGPHIDFQASPGAYSAIFERIKDREGYWDDAPHPFDGPRGVDHNVTVYFRDPDGNRYQVSPAGSHV